MKYRAEIDGLRAVAVISVILFHAGFERFKGGFVGVDVFFVISGYLITTIILVEKEQGTYSLLNFYERRARRILPALFLVMLASLPFAWLWLLASDMKSFSRSLIAVSLFSSNILFWRESGYWGTENELKPLLHTWSLAVEEQYYVLFPLFLMVMWRFRRRWILSSFIAIAAISLGIAQWGAYHEPVSNFLLLPTRGWELAIGATIAFYLLYRKQAINYLLSYKSVNETLGIIGLVMIGYSVYKFNENMPFPSIYALIPTTGAALIIIFSSPASLIGKLLGSKALVRIGLISYSAYLWHQPIFSFARHRSLMPLSKPLLLLLAIISFLFAYLSWKYVERPFRNKTIVSRKMIFAFWAFGSTLFISIGFAGKMTYGFAERTTKSELTLSAIDEKLKINHGLNNICEEKFTLSRDCRTSDEPEILIWGDSFAMHLVQGIMASNPDAKVIQMTKSVCGPFFDVAPVNSKYPISWAKGCLKFTQEVREWLKANNSVKYAVLSSPFYQYIFNDIKLLFRSGKIVDANFDIAVKEFKKTLDELKEMGIEPVIFSPPPSVNGVNLGRCLGRAELIGLDLDRCNFKLDELYHKEKIVYSFLESIMKKNNRVIRLDNLLCSYSVCSTHIGSTFIYRDGGHLSHEGSAEIGRIYNFYRMIVENH
jgi:peptidoglycan/LPS O-acetylase OafA/YrhL